MDFENLKTHDTVNCSVLKRGMEEKQLKGNLIKVAQSLCAKFDAENAKDTVRERDQPHEIMMIGPREEGRRNMVI